jgi:two-component system, NtrC family, sensor kinase
VPFVRIKWWNRLAVKLAVVTATVTVATIAALTYMTIESQKRNLEAEVVNGAAVFSDTIKSSTHQLMLADQRLEAYEVMGTIGRQKGVEKVRIFNKEGRITFSTQPREIGATVNTRAEACVTCHAANRPIERPNLPNRARQYTPNGHRVLGMVTPIYNEKACAEKCHHDDGSPVHPASKSVLGVLDVVISLEAIDQKLAAIRASAIGLASLGILLLAAGVTLFARWLVVRPVASLVDGTQWITRGDLDHEIQVPRTDELGTLASSFNDMTRSLKTTRRELRELNDGLEHQVEERTAQLKAAQAQLIQSEKLSSLGKLAASIAHEINNPLAGILVYSKLMIRMQEDGDVSEKARAATLKNLRLVQRETERCSAIVRNLLDFARQRPVSLKPIDVASAVSEALTLVEHQMSMQQITLEKQLGGPAIVEADFGQLRQAFLNITLNACDAMAKGGRLTVVSRALPDERAVEIVFEDTGVGISPDHLSKILDPFFTTKEKGTGLGLSVVYGIVERLKGKLNIESQVGKGTRVTIRLPVMEAGAPV